MAMNMIHPSHTERSDLHRITRKCRECHDCNKCGIHGKNGLNSRWWCYRYGKILDRKNPTAIPFCENPNATPLKRDNDDLKKADQ